MTESRILGAVSKLDEFLSNPQIKTHSETVPGTFWKTKERMRTTPRVILILKQASSAARLHKTLAQKTVVTVVLFYSVHRVADVTKKSVFFSECSIAIGKVSVQTIMEEIGVVVAE